MAEHVKTARLTLSAPKLSDVPALFGFLGDPVAMAYTQCDANLTACRRRIAVHEWKRRHDGYAPWTVRLKQTGTVIGWGGLYEDPFDPGWGIELGYAFAPAVWGQGYATELCRAALDLADRRLQVKTVSAFAHPENTASCALLAKMGFAFQRHVGEMNRNLYRRERQAGAGLAVGCLE